MIFCIFFQIGLFYVANTQSGLDTKCDIVYITSFIR